MTTESQPILNSKICSECKLSLPLDGFYKRTSGKPFAFCKSCKKDKASRYYEKNRATVLQSVKEYYRANKEQLIAYQVQYRETNKERLKQKVQDRFTAHPELRKVAYRRSRDWAVRNREKSRLHWVRRRARKRNSEGTFSVEEWLQLKASYGDRCLRCGKHESELSQDLTKDHIIPPGERHGGTEWIWNIQPLCRSCNSSKNDDYIVDYRTEGFYLREVSADGTVTNLGSHLLIT